MKMALLARSKKEPQDHTASADNPVQMNRLNTSRGTVKRCPERLRHSMNCIRLIICTALLIVLTGCATLWPPPQEDLDARRLINKVQNHNTQLKQYKALANVYIGANGGTLSGRVAMAAVLPDRLRLEWLSAVGQPLTRFAGDGQQITIAIPGEVRVRRMPQRSAALEPLIQIPIGIEELQSLATGRPKLPEYAAAQIESRDQERVVIALKDRWHRRLAKVEVDPNRSRLMRMEHLDQDEATVYTIDWKKWKPAGAYEIPELVELTTPSGQKLELSMARFWPNADLPSSLFQLTLPVTGSDSGREPN
jgi:outer membrane biogenesis lipoprotein LolB